MPYDLRFEPWIPMRRRSGQVDWLPPTGIVDRGNDDPVVALAGPRPDFNAALHEFLIGLMTVTMDVDDEDGWYEWWEQPPSTEQLHNRLSKLPEAFFLDGDGARFLQDFDASAFADVEVSRIEQLLMDSPGDETLRQNKDLFVKRARVNTLGRPAAAMALLTLQTFAPSGGQGHRTSMRGGGPLTTLGAIAGEDGGELSLWSLLWANVETREQWAGRISALKADTPALRYPWMAATRTSQKEGGVGTTPEDAHPLQSYFGMPRRIRLLFEGEGMCDLLGRVEPLTTRGYVTRNFGVKYEAWRHPLSPYYRTKPGAELLPVHRAVESLVWRDWLGMTLGAPDGLREPARAVAHLVQHRMVGRGNNAFTIVAWGFDMDNMKSRGWIDARMPALRLPDAGARELTRHAAARLTEGTAQAEFAILRAIVGALYERTDDAKGDRGHLKVALWHGTEEAFYRALAAAASATSPEPVDAAVARFRQVTLEPAALRLFDEQTDSLGTEPTALRRVVQARYRLQSTLRGFGKDGERLFKALGLPAPQAATKSTRKRKEKTA